MAEGLPIIAVGASAAAGFCVFYAADIFKSRWGDMARRLRFEARVAQVLAESRFGGPNRLALDRVAKLRPVRALETRLAGAGLARAKETAVYLFAAAIGFFLTYLFFLKSVSQAALVIIAGVATVLFWINSRVNSRKERFAEQLPAVFKLAAGALAAGSSLRQALEHAARQSESPAREELMIVTEEMSLGISLDETLDRLYFRFPLSELRIIAVCFSVQRKIGGNLVKLLLDMVEAIEARRELQRALIVETAQARLSARIIGLMPVVVTVAMVVIDPGFIAPMFVTVPGLSMLAMAFSGEVAGFLIIRRILDIRI